MWDGDGAWRETAPAPALPPPERRCERLLAAAAAFKAHDARDNATPPESPLATEVSRLVRSEGAAAAARLAVACADASGSAAAHAAAKRGDLEGLDAVARLFPVSSVFSFTPGKEAQDGPEDASDASSGSAPERVVTRRDLLRRGDARAASRRWRWRRGAGTRAWRTTCCAAAPARRARDDYGVAALHKAVGHGHMDVARRILADGGADVNVRVGAVAASVPKSYAAESRGQTRCTSRAAESRATKRTHGAPQTRARLVATLLRYGADPNARDALGETPLHHALEACDAASARLLARAGADPNARDAAGRTRRDALELSSARAGCNRGLLRDILRTKGAV